MRLSIIKAERGDTYYLTFRHGDDKIPEIVGYAVIPKKGNSILRTGQLEIEKRYDFHSIAVKFKGGYVHFFVEH